MSLRDAPRMTPTDFAASGALLEVNRVVLHPVGLALAIEPDGTLVVLDDRADPGGIWFERGIEDEASGFPLAADRAETFKALWDARRPARVEALGFMIQPREAL
jgi:hypothetical protein